MGISSKQYGFLYLKKRWKEGLMIWRLILSSLWLLEYGFAPCFCSPEEHPWHLGSPGLAFYFKPADLLGREGLGGRWRGAMSEDEIAKCMSEMRSFVIGGQAESLGRKKRG